MTPDFFAGPEIPSEKVRILCKIPLYFFVTRFGFAEQMALQSHFSIIFVI
jgi:hypothetical protein